MSTLQTTPVVPVGDIGGDQRSGPSVFRRIVLLAVTSISAGLTAWIIGATAAKVSGDHNAPWIVGRASGITCYLLLVALVASGLLLSHPWRVHYPGTSSAARIRIHVSLAVFTLAFLVLHVVVLATDPYAGIGITGALLPFSAEYRPAAVSMGVIGVYAGLLAGVTASLSTSVARRLWWPIHKVAALTLVLIWCHSIWSGSDTVALTALYVVTGFGVVMLAVSRYVARTPRDRVAELQRASTPR